ncbi:glycine cleavage system aminomethyltransferase GcvT [Microbacterium sp. MPKO10]|uniref:glycine cleavage system aminomethyltransferase GcvT n=1 Tax=Microbacterium sp. MPKO10 TaxID=2989818 RepID=UPI002236909E|nr:glycine cleavage system aminomethyltransferase GcvT [Microbacterium sp. MPKO10]MCW4458061.1 glycine cleavage system aminomethyltransferase GcvT [Microbacterium sp. MPKO10]
MPDKNQTDSHAESPRPSPLHATHEKLGATFTDFAGWQMPVRYSSDLAEHKAVRASAGIFDISHMAEFTVTGTEAGEFLDVALAGRLSALKVGRAKYSLLLTETGGVIDDVIVYRLRDDEYLIISNAANRDAARSALQDRTQEFDVGVSDVSDDYALIAVQGPHAEKILSSTSGITDLTTPWDEQRYFAWASASFDGAPLLLARTGYTGEDGFELLVPAARATALWAAVSTAGDPYELVPAGLAARDSLRLEAGMPLYGHELSRDTKPAQAGLGRVVVTAKERFVGQRHVEPAADARVLVGLTSEGRRAGRAGYPVIAGDSEVGTVTSGILSPTLGHPIAMAFVDPTHSDPGTELDIDVRGKRIPATVTTLPFYSRKK